MSLRLSEELLREVERLASEMGVPKSLVVREALAAYVAQPAKSSRLSGWNRVSDMVGSVEIDEAAVASDEIASRIRRHNWRAR